MKPVTVHIEINCPPQVAWEYMLNAEHNPEWLPNMRSCTWITDPPIRVGSRYDQVARFLGKDVRTSFEVTALDDGRLITITSLPGSSFPLTITREVEPIDDGRCLVRETAWGEPGGFFVLAQAPMRALVRRNIALAYRGLKQLLETQVESA
jgi:uncharacterized membrane protein